MRTWNTEIRDRLKTGSIGHVALFGDSDTPPPAPPYVVVKPLASGDAKLFTVYAHFRQGEQDALEAYLLQELPELLEEPLATDEDQTFVLDARQWMLSLAVSDDQTISGSRDFYIPLIL